METGVQVQQAARAVALRVRRRRVGPGAIATNTLIYASLSIASVVMLLPMIWMISSSFKTMGEIFRYPPTIIPATPSLNGYAGLFEQYPFARNLLNSAYVSTSFTILALFFCSLGGYTFAKHDFPGKEVLFLIILGSMVIPFEVTMVPLYVLFRKIGWINKHWGLIIPGAANAFGIFFMRQYANAVPTELLEAGRIDGCSEFALYYRVALPIMTPALTSLGIIFFMSSWNSFLWPLVILKSAETLTAAVAVRSLQGAIYPPYDMIMAGSFLTTLPLIILFLVLQKKFIAGITAGALKG